jgi:hypothetical protein
MQLREPFSANISNATIPEQYVPFLTVRMLRENCFVTRYFAIHISPIGKMEYTVQRWISYWAKYVELDEGRKVTVWNV